MPFNVIQAPTVITGTLFGVIDPQEIATLSNGGYVLTYDASAAFPNTDVFSVVFGPQGQFVGSEDTTQSQIETIPAVTALAGGGYALAWQGFQAGPFDLFTAVFDAQGQQISPFVDVSSGAANGGVVFPVLTGLSTGGYAATWENGDIFTRVYDASGQPVGGPIDVTNDDLQNFVDQVPVAAVLSNGNYALAWTHEGFSTNDIFTAVYNDQGQQVLAAVNVSNSGAGADVKIAALSNGDYALTWGGGDSTTGPEAFVAIYGGQGQQIVAPFVAGAGFEPQIAALANGNYAIFYDTGLDVFTAVYDAQGNQVSAPVNVSNDGHQDYATQVTALSNGDYALTWEDTTEIAGGYTDVFTAVYSAQGQQLVAPINVSNSPNVYDTFSSATALANGSYVISWQSTPGNFFTDIYTAIYQFVDPNVTSGDVSIIGTSDVIIDLSSLITITGSLTINDNPFATVVSLGDLTTVTGSVTLDNNTSATVIGLGA